MKPNLILHQHLGLKTFLVSIIIHGVLFQGLVITFNPRPSLTKPYFVFFGSILDSYDFHPAIPLTPMVQHPASPANVVILQKKNISSTALTKPSLVPQLNKGTKTVTKSRFQIEEPQEAQKPPTPDDLGIDLNVPQRLPLRLYDK